MPQHSLKVILRNGSVRVFPTRHGGQHCPVVLIRGPFALAPDKISYDDESTWYDEVCAEGSYLADFGLAPDVPLAPRSGCYRFPTLTPGRPLHHSGKWPLRFAKSGAHSVK